MHDDDNSGSCENILTSIPFDKYVTTTILSVNSEGEREEKEVILNEAFHFYNQISGCVDEANRSIMSCYYTHRVFHYQTALMVFFLVMIAHNARILYNLKSGKNLNQLKYLQKLSNELYTITEIEPTQHTLVTLSRRKHCVVCYWLQRQAGVTRKDADIPWTSVKCAKCNVPMCN